MSRPQIFSGIRLPVIAAPMFLVSGPELTMATCLAGVPAAFPALNQRSSEGFEQWVTEISEACAKQKSPKPAPYGVNLIVHRSNPRLEADLKICIKHKVPFVVTSLGAVSDVVKAVQSYGGVVFHDVTNSKHAQKASEAGVDGLILVAGGAGGHAGTINPFALLGEIRQFFRKTIILAGAISSGRDIAAAQMLGADFAYMGTRFIATKESQAQPEYKKMITDAVALDIVHTPAVSGVPASFMRQSLEQNGYKMDKLHEAGHVNFGEKLTLDNEAKAWKNIWSAGQGVSNIEDIPAAADLVSRLEREYRDAIAEFKVGSQEFL